MRTIVAGCRYGVDYADVVDAIEQCGWTPSVIISGGASGADAHGEHYAVSHGIQLRFIARTGRSMDWAQARFVMPRWQMLRKL
jgi:hypothetical protein